MITRIQSSRIITPEGLFSGYVYLDETQILQVTAEELPCERTYDFGDQYVSPGFIDLHVHGGNGKDFCQSSPQEVAAAADFHLRHGTTTIVPTITSVSFDATSPVFGATSSVVTASFTAFSWVATAFSWGVAASSSSST